MTEDKPKKEYDISYFHVIIFILALVVLFLISFFAGYYAGKSSLPEQKIEPKKNKIVAEKGNTKSDLRVKKTQKKEEVKLPKEDVTDIEGKREKKQEANKIKTDDNKELLKDISNDDKAVEYRKGFYVQVAAEKSLNVAKKKADTFRKEFGVVIFYPFPKEDENWYRVRIGPFQEREEAQEVVDKVKSKYGVKDCWIIKVD